MQRLMGLLIREAGKSAPNAIAESARGGGLPALLRGQVRRRFDNATHLPLGRWCASARGTSRWRSSSARYRRRWPPATRCWPSRRTDALIAPRRCARCGRRRAARGAAAAAGPRAKWWARSWWRRARARRAVHRLDRSRPHPAAHLAGRVNARGNPVPLVAEPAARTR
jgi:hypothetical protein